MDSSTSPSNLRFPVRAAGLLLVALVTWAICAFYTLRFNPEIINDVQGFDIRTQWAEKMTQQYGSKILVYGGSSCEFSIDGERMLSRFNLPTVNCGGEAGMGAAVLTESVLERVRPSDTLIVACEPGLLTGDINPTPLGTQFSFATHHSGWVLHPALNVAPLNWFQALADLRPGGYHFFTLLGKIAGRKPLMRYQLSDYHPSGWMQTAVRMKITGPAGHGPFLSDGSRTLLYNLRLWCEARHVRIAYSLPWSYCPPEKETTFQKGNIDFLLQMNEFMPVLKDAQLGANTNIDYYADTAWHLTGPGSALRTDSLGEQIKDWNVWTADDLRQCEAGLQK